jgi:hypothetical protein
MEKKERKPEMKKDMKLAIIVSLLKKKKKAECKKEEECEDKED